MDNTQPQPPMPFRKTHWAWMLATVLGAGFLRPGPGTYGSAAALAVWFGAIHSLHPSGYAQTVGTLIAAVVVTVIGIPVSTIVARESSRPDPGHVVIDEFAGQLVALIAIPADWKHAALAFLLFRFFDIFKPPPIRQIERLHGGAGIMLDDIAAGLFALTLGTLARLIF